MKKRLLLIVTAIALILSLAACGGGSSSSKGPAPTTKKSYSFTIGSGHSPAGFPYVSAAQDFFEPEVIAKAAELGYEVTFTEAYGGTIAPLANMFEATASGQLDIGVANSLFEPTKAMLLNYNAYCPFGIDDVATSYEIGTRVYEANKETIDKMLAQYDIKYLGVGIPISSYNLRTQFPVESIADLKGHKIAAAGANLYLLNGIGATGVESNLNEAYTSLQTGVYEGWIVWPNGVNGYKMDEVAEYYTKTGFGNSNTCHLLFNMDTWNSLPEDLQNVFLDAAVGDYKTKGLERAASEDAAAYEAMESHGTIVTEMSEEARTEWIMAIEDPAVAAIEEMEKAGLPAAKVFSDFYTISEELGYTSPRRFGQ